MQQLPQHEPPQQSEQAAVPQQLVVQQSQQEQHAVLALTATLGVTEAWLANENDAKETRAIMANLNMIKSSKM